jgi:hypothetical protein
MHRTRRGQLIDVLLSHTQHAQLVMRSLTFSFRLQKLALAFLQFGRADHIGFEQKLGTRHRPQLQPFL